MNFGIKLLPLLDYTGFNTAISPYSAQLALRLIWKGSSGSTREELESVLELNNSHDDVDVDDDGFVLKVANGIWSNCLKPEYVNEISKECNVFPLTSSSSEAIRDWSLSKTDNRIDLVNCLPSNYNVDEDTVLINALYFQGLWKYPFRLQKVNSLFQTFDDQMVVDATFMERTATYEYAMDQNKQQLIRLPYVTNSDHHTLEMLIFLPTNIVEFVSSPDQIQQVFNMKTSSMKVSFSIPKFKIESTLTDMKQLLQNLGLKSTFSDQPNFDRMMKQHGTYISDMIQKLFIQVDENGTEAAAVTEIIMTRSIEPFVTMTCSKPFFFAILLNNNTILFAGAVGHSNHISI